MCIYNIYAVQQRIGRQRARGTNFPPRYYGNRCHGRLVSPLTLFLSLLPPKSLPVRRPLGSSRQVATLSRIVERKRARGWGFSGVPMQKAERARQSSCSSRFFFDFSIVAEKILACLRFSCSGCCVVTVCVCANSYIFVRIALA